MSRSRTFLAVAVAGGITMLAGGSSAFAADPPGNTSYYDTASHTVDGGSHCYPGLPHTDLLPTPAGGTTTLFTGSALLACSPPVNGTLSAGTGTLHAWFTNAGKKDCSTFFFLAHNATSTTAPQSIVGSGSSYGGAPYIYVPAKTTKEVVVNFNVPQTTLTTDDQITLWIDVSTASGSCSNMTLYYGSASRETYVSIPPIV
jgi:hypothetical protein